MSEAITRVTDFILIAFSLQLIRNVLLCGLLGSTHSTLNSFFCFPSFHFKLVSHKQTTPFLFFFSSFFPLFSSSNVCTLLLGPCLTWNWPHFPSGYCELLLELCSCASGLASEVTMISVTSKSVDFAGKNFVSCGCSSNSSFDRYTVRNYAKVNSKGYGGRANGTRKLVCCKRKNTQCRVSSMKIVEPTLNGIIVEFNFYPLSILCFQSIRHYGWYDF